MNRQESISSILTFWQEIVNDDEMPVQNRMKASELLYRSLQGEPQAQTESAALPPDEVTKRIAAAKAIIAKYAGRGGNAHG